MNRFDACLRELRAAELELVMRELQPGMRVLEIGGGSGWQARLLSERGFTVESIDIDPVGSWNERHFSVRQYDGMHIPFADGQFDCVFSSNVLEHVPQVSGLIAESRRVLRPGGVAVHLLPSVPWRFWTSLTHYPFVAKTLVVGNPARGQDALRAIGSALASRGWLHVLKRALVDGPHGVSKSAFHELAHFSRRRWRREFESAGFTVRKVSGQGLFYTGHLLFAGFSLGTRRALARALGSSCHLFVLQR